MKNVLLYIVSQLGLMFEQLHRHFQPSARASWSRASQSDSRILTATAATATDPQADHLGSQRSLRNALSFYRGPRAHNPSPIFTAAGKILLANLVETPTQGLISKTKEVVKKERTFNMLCLPNFSSLTTPLQRINSPSSFSNSQTQRPPQLPTRSCRVSSRKNRHLGRTSTHPLPQPSSGVLPLDLEVTPAST